MKMIERIGLLEGSCAATSPPVRPANHFTGDWGFIKVTAVARTNEPGLGSFVQAQQTFLSGLYAANCPWGFLVTGSQTGVAVHFALPGSNGLLASWEARLLACFPGCEFRQVATRGALEQQVASFGSVAALTGNPSVNGPAAPSNPAQVNSGCSLQTLLRNMAGREFAYVVLARPLSEPDTRAMHNSLAAEEREVASAYQRRGTAEENNHPQARQYLDLLRSAQNNFHQGLSLGMWEMTVHLRTRTAADLFFGTQALHAAFSGAGSKPQPIRIQPCANQQAPGGRPWSTRLNTVEAVALTKLPEEEMPGYQVRDYVRFAVSPPVVTNTPSVEIGIVLDGGKRTANWFPVGLDDLARHALVVGASGSGKTNTCQHLLLQLWNEARVPWLVVEPSMKSEYRRLLRSRMADDLRIFTLGDESGVPFRLNPLEVLPGIHVQTQIDALLSLFGAAFGWVSPMPEVLNLAVHRLYQEQGWDLVHGTHTMGYGPEVQPTLGDLLRLLPSFVAELGYNAEISSTIRAGLLTRLSSLTSGGKGRMLNAGVSIPFDELLSRPTILELAAIGNDEEKAFVAGAILMRLSQHRQAIGLTESGLRHVLLIEEAHRLLAATPLAAGNEVANPRAKAVETFCNLLAEVRAYGQGVIVADQIPSKLVSDILKNVNLRVVHRLPAAEDRQLMGATMNLTPAHERFLATLNTGNAVVFAEGRELASHLTIPNAAFQMPLSSGLPTKSEVVGHMRSRQPRLPTAPARSAVASCMPASTPTCPGCAAKSCLLRPAVLQLMATKDLALGFQQAIGTGWDELWNFGLGAVGHFPAKEQPAAAHCLLMNIAVFGKFDRHALAQMHANLEPKLLAAQRNGGTVYEQSID